MAKIVKGLASKGKKFESEKNTRFMNLEDIFMFGKYDKTGKTVEEVLEDDPEYIRSLIESGISDFEDAVYAKLEKAGK
jgi:aspartate oxidase